jgi:hypothetical protein
MKTITKIVGLSAVGVVAATLGWHALAETPMHGGPNGMGPGMMTGMAGGHGPMGGGFADPATHLASLKTELGITAQQEPAWAAYSTVLQETATSIKAQHQGMDMAAIHNMSDQDRQAFMTQMREQHTKAFTPVKAAAEKLLTALDDTQKTKAKEILPGLAEHGPGMMRHVGMSGHGPMQHGGDGR